MTINWRRVGALSGVLLGVAFFSGMACDEFSSRASKDDVEELEGHVEKLDERLKELEEKVEELEQKMEYLEGEAHSHYRRR
jgi:predicted RNase H-like nuclease (RuvC/YqgF family)